MPKRSSIVSSFSIAPSEDPWTAPRHSPRRASRGKEAGRRGVEPRPGRRLAIDRTLPALAPPGMLLLDHARRPPLTGLANYFYFLFLISRAVPAPCQPLPDYEIPASETGGSIKSFLILPIEYQGRTSGPEANGTIPQGGSTLSPIVRRIQVRTF